MKTPPRAVDWRRPHSLAAFGKMLRRARVALGFTLDDLMAKTRISKPYLSNIETGRAPGPASEEKLRRVARALGLPEKDVAAGADWLRTPESVRRLVAKSGPPAELPRRPDGAIDLDAALGAAGTQKPKHEAPSESSDAIPLRAVPLINRVAAGRASEYTDLDYPRGVADQYIPAPDLPESPVGSAFGVRVVGDSMMPEYAEGEILIVGPAGEGDLAVKDGDDCVVRLGEQENFATTFKRIFFAADLAGNPMQLRMVPINPTHAERVVPMEQVSGIYRVLWRVKAGRRG